MADLKIVARLARWAAESMAHQLSFIPEDKLNWKPNPESKSAAQAAGEAVGVMKLMVPVLTTGGFAPASEPYPVPATVEEARRLLLEVSEQFAAGLEAAGPELERQVATPFGELWGPLCVSFGLVDLLHHHGQITYIQCLLGDGVNHGDPASVSKWFGQPV